MKGEHGMKLYLIDYKGVNGNKEDGWQVGHSRIRQKMFCCRTLLYSDILDALRGWGVLPTADGYSVVDEYGQLTVFETATDRPVCGLFTVGMI
jgi:hypothetical protein